MSSSGSRRVQFSTQNTQKLPRPSRNSVKKNKERTKKSRRAWDATVSDLSVHKLSREEVELRHKSHMSKNAELAKHDLYEKAKENYDLDSSGNLRPSPLVTREGSLLRSLQGKDLHEVLAESDRALRVVKDMFGDDPMRYTCQPNVTVAPHIVKNKTNLERTLQESHRDGPPPTALASPGGIRDESIQELAPRKPALNEVPSPQGSNEQSMGSTLTPHNTTPQGRGYKPSLDLKRFQELIAKEEKIYTKDVHTGKTTSIEPPPVINPDNKVDTTGIKHSTSRSQNKNTHKDIKNLPPPNPLVIKTRPTLRVQVPMPTVEGADSESLSGLSDISSIRGAQPEGGQDLTVESDTSVIMRGTMMRPPSEHPLHVAHKMTPGKKATDNIYGELGDLEKIVHNLNKELQECEYSTTIRPPHSTNNTRLMSITSTLLTSVTKITRYLQESEAQLRGEVEVREHLLQTMAEQQNLMDALTSDVVKLQKESMALKKTLKEVQHTTSEQLLSMEREVSDVHKKLSTWTNKQTLAASQTLPSHQILSTSVAPTKSEVKDNTMPKEVETSVSNRMCGTSEQLYHPSHQTVLSRSPTTSVSSFESIPIAHPVPSQRAPLHRITPTLGQPSHASPYIQAQLSPLSYDMTTSTSKLDGGGLSSGFISRKESKDLEVTLATESEFAAGDSPHDNMSTFNDSYAPPPPPLSIALQVPVLTTPSEIMRTSVDPLSSLKTNSDLMFDVAGFLTDLGKLGTVEENEFVPYSPSSPFSSHTRKTASRTSLISTNSQVSFPAYTTSTITNHPPLPTTSTATTPALPNMQAFQQKPSVNVVKPEISLTTNTTTKLTTKLSPLKGLPTPQQGLQAPDLSMSLFSTITEQQENSPVVRGSLIPEETCVKNSMVGDNMLLHSHPQRGQLKQNGWFALTSHVPQH